MMTDEDFERLKRLFSAIQINGGVSGGVHFNLGEVGSINYGESAGDKKREEPAADSKDKADNANDVKDKAADAKDVKDVKDVNDLSLSPKDEQVRRAVDIAINDKTFKKSSDWGLIRIGMGLVGITFNTTEHFVNYLQSTLHFTVSVSISTINRCTHNIKRGKDDFEYDDTKDRAETVRRNDIIRRFVGAYNKKE